MLVQVADTSRMPPRPAPLQGSGACHVVRQCRQIRDPCTAYSTNWACLADPACRLVPSHNENKTALAATSAAYVPLLGSRCVSTTDWCAGLGSEAECQEAAGAGCAAVPACTSSHCAAGGADACCGKNEALCGADAGCAAGLACVPLVDECASVLTKSGCSALAYCK
jgi:hypothetical protein